MKLTLGARGCAACERKTRRTPLGRQLGLSRLMLNRESRAASLASYAASRMAATWFSFCRTLLKANGSAPNARAADIPRNTFFLLATCFAIPMAAFCRIKSVAVSCLLLLPSLRDCNHQM